jgi:hypothetical protein
VPGLFLIALPVKGDGPVVGRRHLPGQLGLRRLDALEMANVGLVHHPCIWVGLNNAACIGLSGT